MSICVLGGTGFIGRHLIDSLKRLTGIKVKILLHNKKKRNDYPEHFQLVEGDIRLFGSLDRFLEPNAIVVNLVYLNSLSADDNIQAVDNLAKACIKVGVARLIHCSTAIVVGDVKDDVITEEIPCFPTNRYEKTKLKLENLLLDSLKDKCEIVIIRPTVVFGEGGKNLLKMANDLSSGMTSMTSLKASLYYRRRMNLVCVGNVVAAILFISQLEQKVSGERFIVSDDDVEENNYLDILNSLSNFFNLDPPKIINIPLRYALFKSLFLIFRGRKPNVHRIYSAEKLIALGFKKPIQFEKGIKQFASWYLTSNSFSKFKKRAHENS